MDTQVTHNSNSHEPHRTTAPLMVSQLANALCELDELAKPESLPQRARSTTNSASHTGVGLEGHEHRGSLNAFLSGEALSPLKLPPADAFTAAQISSPRSQHPSPPTLPPRSQPILPSKSQHLAPVMGFGAEAHIYGEKEDYSQDRRPPGCANINETILKYGHDEDFVPYGGPLFLPTDAPAGTPEKISVLRERVRLGQPLWHPLDRIDFAGITTKNTVFSD